MKPNFKEMSRKELRRYILTHKDDDEAIEELFVNRRDPNAKRYPPDLSLEEMEAIFREQIEKKEKEEN